MSVGFGRVFIKLKKLTGTDHFSVDFSASFSMKPAKETTFQRIQCACVVFMWQPGSNRKSEMKMARLVFRFFTESVGLFRSFFCYGGLYTKTGQKNRVDFPVSFCRAAENQQK